MGETGTQSASRLTGVFRRLSVAKRCGSGLNLSSLENRKRRLQTHHYFRRFPSATCERNRLLEEIKIAATKNGGKTIPAFVSGTAEGRLFMTFPPFDPVVWARLVAFSDNVPRASKEAAPRARTLRKPPDRLFLFIIHAP